jgi:hypothetical protein
LLLLKGNQPMPASKQKSLYRQSVFLLSPAHAGGVKAKLLVSEKSRFETALRFRSREGLSIAEAYSFMSALYFRGKVAYSLRFGSDYYVIVPGFGLVPLDWKMTPARFDRLKEVEVDPRCAEYTRSLQKTASRVAASIPADCRVVLLGSIATDKYVNVLAPIFKRHLHYPKLFSGRGDMSRGALMLQASRTGQELEYAPVLSKLSCTVRQPKLLGSGA